MNILVIRFSSLGDVVLVSSLLSWLFSRHPGARCTLLTGSAYAPLFADDPRVERTVPLADARTVTGGTAWDLVLDLQNNRQSRTFTTSLPGRPRVRRFDKMHAARWTLLTLRLNRYDPALDVASRYIAAASPDAGRVVPPPLRLFFSEALRDRAYAWYREQTGKEQRPSIALFPFSAWRNKEWPADAYASVGAHFIAQGWNVAIFGSPDEAPKAEALKARIGEGCVSIAGRLSLEECGALLSRFSLALGNDTGLVHLARAAGVATGILFGPTTRHFGFYPFGEPAVKIFEKKLFCRPCHAHGGNHCLRLTRPCLRAITPGEVIEGLDGLLRSRDKNMGTGSP